MISTTISESGYEGWVAWVDENTPIFEHVEFNPKLLPLVSGPIHTEYRARDRNTMEWRELPHDKLCRVELYFAKEKYPDQPVLRIDREPGLDLRFIQMKIGSIVVDTGGNLESGQKRIGVIGYRMGFWIPGRKECQLWEITRNELQHMGKVSDPCAPRPKGFGLAPHVIGR